MIRLIDSLKMASSMKLSDNDLRPIYDIISMYTNTNIHEDSKISEYIYNSRCIIKGSDRSETKEILQRIQ